MDIPPNPARFTFIRFERELFNMILQRSRCMISTVSLSFNIYSLVPKNKCTSCLLRSQTLFLVWLCSLPRRDGRQLPTTAGQRSCTCLVVFSSPMGRETPRRGSTSPVSLTRTRRGAAAGLLECWGSCTGSFARRVAGVRRTLSLERCVYLLKLWM